MLNMEFYCGPSHAEEVSLQIPTAIVIASKNDDVFTYNTKYLYG